MVVVVGIKQWDNGKGGWDYLPGKCTLERFNELTALCDTKPQKINGGEEEVAPSEIDAKGWYYPDKREHR